MDGILFPGTEGFPLPPPVYVDDLMHVEASTRIGSITHSGIGFLPLGRESEIEFEC